MKSSSKALLVIAFVLGLIALGMVLLRAPDVPDQVQITNQLETARAAGEAHDVNGVMRIVSSKFHSSDIPSPIQLRFLLNRVQGNEAVRVTQSIPVVSVQGDTATSTSHLRIARAADNQVVYDHDVTIQWAREDGNRLGVIPTKVWRAVSADVGNFFGD
jgi:hypothetical protein